MILYRQAIESDFNLTFEMKKNSTKEIVEKIWGWDDTVQLDYHKKQFDPEKTKIIIDDNQEVGFLSIIDKEDILYIENIIIDKSFQGNKLGTNMLLETIKMATGQKKNVELQVFKINYKAIKLYERLNFKTFGETELHYKMRYDVI